MLFLIFFLFKFSFHFFHPNISIIIPIFNINKYLNQCLNSIINQTLKNIEIICVYEHSNDNNSNIIMQFVFDKRIIILNKTKSGYGDLMNHGIKFATGQYISIIMADDFVDFYMFEHLYNLTKNNEIDIVKSNYYFYRMKKKKAIRFNIEKKLYNKVFNPIDNPKIFYIFPSIRSAIYKKDLLIKNNIKFLTTSEASYQYISFFFKTLFKSKKVYFSNKRFSYYNINSSVKNNSLIKAFLIHKEFEEIEKFIKKDLNAFKKIEKYFNNIKLLNFIWNLKRVNKKSDYIKIFYKDTYNILKNNNYFEERMKKFEIKFLNYLRDFGEKIALDFFLSQKYYIKNPKISIIIPIYNSEKYIKECLKSLIDQTFKDFEIICVNDGSTDKTLDILKKFEKIDKRITIISQKNLGAGIARNIGMNNSKGDYLIFLDSDDIFKKTMLEQMYKKIKKNDAEIVICNSINFETIKKKKIFFKKNYLISDKKIKNRIFSSFDIKKDFFNLFIWWPWDKIIKKKYIENLGIKYQNLKSTNDLFFVASAVISAKKILFLDKNLIFHRINIKTSISNTRENSWNNFYYALLKLRNFIKKKGFFNRFKQDFINFVASFSLWHLETIKGKPFCLLFEKLKNEWWKEFEVLNKNEKYFYDKNIYKKLKDIMEFDLKNTKILDENRINYFNLKKNACFPKISIIIPVFNSEKYLFDSLNSIINQSLKEIEIICINDGSYDNSLNILNYYKKIDNRIIIINQKNKGVNSARNSGLKIAKGEFILFFDSDDQLKSNALEIMYEFSNKNNLEILFFNVELKLKNKTIENKIFPFNIFYSIDNKKIINNKTKLFLNFIEKNKFIFSPCFQLIKHSLLINYKINFFEGIFYDDYLFNFKLLNSFNISFEINQTFYYKFIYKNLAINKNYLLKKLHDNIINIREFLIYILKCEKESIIQNYFEIFINNLEELIFFAYKQIDINEFFYLNQWEKKDKFLLLLILFNQNYNLNFIDEIYKNYNEKIFYINIWLFKFEKKICFKLFYIINKFKNILLMEKFKYNN